MCRIRTSLNDCDSTSCSIYIKRYGKIWVGAEQGLLAAMESRQGNRRDVILGIASMAAFPLGAALPVFASSAPSELIPVLCRFLKDCCLPPGLDTARAASAATAETIVTLNGILDRRHSTVRSHDLPKYLINRRQSDLMESALVWADGWVISETEAAACYRLHELTG